MTSLPVTRATDPSLTHGHSPIPVIGIQAGVYVNNLPVIVVGDQYTPNNGHNSTVVVGSFKVFVAGLPLVRLGDLMACGDTAGSLCFNVFAG